jgi:2-keto-4-pentenoate hydratase/2-oxohepta-3-ene-1,7-dioic acid hydratase in catechol pathway
VKTFRSRNSREIEIVRLITFRKRSLDRTREESQEEIGALTGGDAKVVRLQAAQQLLRGQPDPRLASMITFLEGGVEAREAAQGAFDFALTRQPEGVMLDRGSVELLSPVPRPESIRDFMSFEQHSINCLRRLSMPRWRGVLDEWMEDALGRKITLAYRMNRAWYERPLYYKGNRRNVVGDGAAVAIPSFTEKLDWELEWGIFLCQKGRDISKEKARKYIGGNTIFNDFSPRDIQAKEMAGRLGPAKGKDFDSGNAIGSVLVTPEEIPDPYNLAMHARINSEEVSYGHTSGMRWSFEEMIAYVSRSETLYPGEFFGSGTGTVPESGKNRRCCGLEMGRYLKAGDRVELEVDRVGTLTNFVVARECRQLLAAGPDNKGWRWLGFARAVIGDRKQESRGANAELGEIFQFVCFDALASNKSPVRSAKVDQSGGRAL